MKFSEIEDAFLFASSGAMYDNQAIVCKQTGEMFYTSEMGDSDKLPDDIDDPEKYIEIPHKNELDLGNNLVFQFVEEQIPEEIDKVNDIFRKRGAYSRFKDLLERKDILKLWHDYENEEQTKALKEWCKENNIDING